MLNIVFMFVCYVCLYNHCFIVIMYVIFNLHGLELECNFIQRTEQVLIELDISAIEENVIIISSSITINTQSTLSMIHHGVQIIVPPMPQCI